MANSYKKINFKKTKTSHLLENGDSDDLQEAVMDAFPSLKIAGGYELLQLDENFR